MTKNIILCCLLFQFALAAPSDNSFVVSTTIPPLPTPKENVESTLQKESIPSTTIDQIDINANVSNRFAKVLVLSKVKNPATTAKEATFSVVLPEKAFISEFVMEIGGKSYKAYVKEKEEAKNIYDQAVASGQSAAHVAVSARDSNRFTVSVNIEPEAKAAFFLTYEELLERKNNQYELVLNIHPGQVVKSLNVEVYINESRPLKFVKTPSLRTGNEISKNEDKLDPLSNIQIINSTSALVKFTPDAEKQKQFAHDLGTKESEGLSGQFVVQYDVDRDSEGGEVLLQDGYFVHFFAPADLEPLPKHIVFVLDTSGSMYGTKIEQLRDAMNSILSEIKSKDLLSIIQFSSETQVWDIQNENKTYVLFTQPNENYKEPFPKLSEFNLPAPILATAENIEKAKNVVKRIDSDGATHMIGGLETALYLVKREQEKQKSSSEKHQPIIIFLTDGQPNAGISSTEEITKIVTKLNSENNNAPIFALSFGYGADKDFLRKLALKNLGFSRHIYEAADASLQLQEFYKQISSPLLSNIKFTYDSGVEKVSETVFPIYFGGSELVVTGRYKDAAFPSIVECFGPKGPIILRPVVKAPVSSLERLWAYLTVKQTLDKRETVENKTELTKKALDLALQYSFVTDVSSLVVVKPNSTSSGDTVGADAGPSSSGSFIGANNFAVLGGGAAGAPPQFFNKAPTLSLSRPQFATQLTTNIPPRPTTIASTPPASTTEIPKQDNSLPWLTSALNPNGTLTLSQGTYEVANVSIPAVADTECPKTPLNSSEAGHCTPLRDCPEVHSHLTDLIVYQQYFCPINTRFAGVCCPKKTKENKSQI